MKIGIIGTRGIPNNYGGFEQFAEYIAPMLVENGHDVTVYSSSAHPYKNKTWKGVKLVHIYDPENKIGTIAQFLYDLLSIMHCRKEKYDIILQLGYTSSSVWSRLFPSNSIVITNMDGMEWKRSKYNTVTKAFLRKAEKWAVTKSHYLISDSVGIEAYIDNKYKAPSTYISYGAKIFQTPAEDLVRKMGFVPYQYNILIARMEPENSILTILQAYTESQTEMPLLVVGDPARNKFGQTMKKKYSSERIIFLGSIYDHSLINNLRYYSNIYFHGHTVGGTNPSLLEAMASNAFIIAHDNIFNRSVLEDNALYFEGEKALKILINNNLKKEDFHHKLKKNLKKIEELHSWPYIYGQIEKLLLNAFSQKQHPAK